MTTERFTHKFRNGLIGTMVFTIVDGSVVAWDAVWSPPMTPKLAQIILPEYRSWRDEVVALVFAKYQPNQKVFVLAA